MVGQSQGRLLSCLNKGLGQRVYTGHTAERKVYKFPEGFDFVQTFPDRKMEKTRDSNQTISNPPPKKRKAEPWSMEDLERYRKHFEVEDMVAGKPNPNPRPTAQDPTTNESTGPLSEQECEQEAAAEIVDRGQRGPLEDSSLDDPGININKDHDKLPDLRRIREGMTVPETIGKNDDSVAALLESRTSDTMESSEPISEEIVADLDNGHQKNLIVTSKEPQDTSTTSLESGSDLDLDQVLSRSNDIREEEEEEAKPFLPANIDSASLLQDEELERAMQHFNLGMWHKPWRPPPKEEEVKKEPQKELLQQLELKEETVEFNPPIHILGLGTAGKYIAHSLAALPNGPPITLLMHRSQLMQQWLAEGEAIRIWSNGEYHVRTGFRVESSSRYWTTYSGQPHPRFGPNLEYSAEPSNTVIETLVVTTDAHTAILALSAIKHRIRNSTTILIMQRGLGIIEALNEIIFPDPRDRPNYILGRISHDLTSTDRHFTVVEKEIGEVQFTLMPRDAESKEGDLSLTTKRENFYWSPQARHLARKMLTAPELSSKALSRKWFLSTQLETLVVGSVIGPLSVAFDCSNNHLLYNYHILQNIRLLLDEICPIVWKFPEFANYKTIKTHFTTGRLERIIKYRLRRTGSNTTSMLQAVRAGKQTDIDFLNGYLIRRATELGMDCSKNQMLLHLVKSKQAISNREKIMYIPFVN